MELKLWLELGGLGWTGLGTISMLLSPLDIFLLISTRHFNAGYSILGWAGLGWAGLDGLDGLDWASPSPSPSSCCPLDVELAQELAQDLKLESHRCCPGWSLYARSRHSCLWLELDAFGLYIG